MDPWKLLLAAVGVALFLEGLPYFVTPAGTRRYLLRLTELGDPSLRAIGLFLMAAGLLTAYMTLHRG